MARRKKDNADIQKTAREHFGFETLRPGQEEAIRSLLGGRDTVVIQPTGAGKSAIYQIAGLLIEGVTVVVSPLIALQKDQVESINERNPAEAVLVNSTQRAGETRESFEKIEDGEAEYIFLAPEQLRKPETMDRLREAGVSLFVVDEAHCISEWGHDFRPDYRQLGRVAEQLDRPAILAMTATASPEVRREIVERLHMENPKILVRGFDRPNIHLRVDHFSTREEKLEALIRRVRWTDKPGIVYAGTRRNAEEVMRALDDEGVHAVFYHAGLKAKERDAIQTQFMAGEAEVIVATSAFGMGVDKADVRFVYHFDIPESLDAYYQEIGRAGRDGEKAEAVLFFRTEDLGPHKFRSGGGRIEPAEVERVLEVVADSGEAVSTQEIAEEAELSQRRASALIHRLEDVGAVEILPTGHVELSEDVENHEAAKGAAEKQELHKELRRERLRQMQDYADSSSCRRAMLLEYFGDEFEPPCNNCDNCEAASAGPAVDPSVGKRREVA